MKSFIVSLIFICVLNLTFGQTSRSFAEDIRIKYKIPELAYAVISSDSVLEISALGIKKNNTEIKADINDKFRIGSITKTVTAFISTLLVKQNKIMWSTHFFDLYPELKNQSDSAYHSITLKNLLTMRAPLMSWTYTHQKPVAAEISGDLRQQRYNFIIWVLKQKPSLQNAEIYWSNLAYVMAGLMLEKASGKSFESLVEEFGNSLNIQFGLGQPNFNDKNQPYGHNEFGESEEPKINNKLNWLSSAGNVYVSLPDFCKFIQVQLKGLSGNSEMLSKEEFEYMHFGLPKYALGWKWYEDGFSKFKYSYHDGNPGTFLTKIIICHQSKKAFVVFTNIQSVEAEKGINELMERLKKRYSS